MEFADKAGSEEVMNLLANTETEEEKGYYHYY